jgi:hypothetical protein
MKELPNPLKYRILEEKVEVENSRVKEYVNALLELISYQYHTIKEQRAEIIALKHDRAWEKYDLSETSPKVCIDKSTKSGNMSC